MITKLNLENVCCNGCKTSVENKTKEIPGVNDIKVDIEGKTASVDHVESLNINTVIEKIVGIGKGKYKATVA